MKTARPAAHKSALWILLGLVLVVVIGIVWRCFNSRLDLVSYVAGCSTLAVAFLTVAYVVTTNNQLSVMHSQLDEMRKAREYQAQPLPIVRDVVVSIEKPRFFYTPPEDRYSAHSRVISEFRVRNEGTHPVVNLVVTGRLQISVGGVKKIFGATSSLVEVIAENGSHPPLPDRLEVFLFANGGTEMIAAIRERDTQSPPLLNIRSVFRNTLGAYYATTSIFMLYLNTVEDDAVLTNWHASIVAFSVEYKTELEQLLKLRKRDGKEWERVFDAVAERFNAKLQGPQKLNLSCVTVPLTFNVEPITEEQYKSEVSKLGFSAPVPAWLEGCLHMHDTKE